MLPPFFARFINLGNIFRYSSVAASHFSHFFSAKVAEKKCERWDAARLFLTELMLFGVILGNVLKKIGFPAVSRDSGSISVLSAPKLDEISQSGAMCRRVPFFTFFLRKSGGEKM